jgi:hypothetical protein
LRGTTCRLEQRAFHHRKVMKLSARQRKLSHAAQIDSLRSPAFLPRTSAATGF